MEQTPNPESKEPEVLEEYTLAEMDKAEGEALTKELQEVLRKYDAELGVVSKIHIYKRVKVAPKEPTVPAGSVPTPFPLNEGPDSDNSGGTAPVPVA